MFGAAHSGVNHMFAVANKSVAANGQDGDGLCHVSFSRLQFHPSHGDMINVGRYRHFCGHRPRLLAINFIFAGKFIKAVTIFQWIIQGCSHQPAAHNTMVAFLDLVTRFKLLCQRPSGLALNPINNTPEGRSRRWCMQTPFLAPSGRSFT